MTESNILSQRLRLSELATNAYVFGSHSQQIPIRLNDQSVPIERIFSLLISRYFPLPQPTSKFREPGSRDSRYY